MSCSQTKRSLIVSENLSKRIRILSLLGAFSVVLIYCAPVLPFQSAADRFIRALLTTAWTQWAVPFFFVVSGFLATLHSQKYSVLLKKKIKTLFIPYLCWAFIGFCILTPANMLQNRLTGEPLLNHTIFEFNSIWQTLNAFIGGYKNPLRGMDGLLGPACNGPLWYIRGLLILFFMFPFLDWMRKKSALILLLIGWFLVLFFSTVVIPYITLPCRAMGYFLLGMTITDFVKYYELFTRKYWIFYGLLALVATIVQAAEQTGGIMNDICMLQYLPRFLPPAAIVFFYYGIEKIEKNIEIDHVPTGLAMWMYCFHGTFISILEGGLVMIFGKAIPTLYIIMLFVPFLTLGICWITLLILEKYCPKLLSVLCGGRS